MKKSIVFSFSLLGQIGFAVAIPLILFALLGRFLDKMFGTAPYLFLTGIATATVLIYFIVKKIAKQALETLNNQ